MARNVAVYSLSASERRKRTELVTAADTAKSALLEFDANMMDKLIKDNHEPTMGFIYDIEFINLSQGAVLIQK